MFERFKKATKLSSRQEGDGHEIEVEVREDEEQSIKLQEIIDLLVAAGYFRARIKGLSPFDKVVGGMTWCIESCSIDIDVDLLFQENSTIGQKIALTEKIVAVLTKIKCPNSLEPHQIQGLDFIHIFPVVQWLVKRSMEYRQERSEFVRSYAVNQFNKTFRGDSHHNCENILKNVNTVTEAYRPRRFYKRKNTIAPLDIKSQVQITLLEYGTHGGLSHGQQKTPEQQIHHLLNNQMLAKEDILEMEELSEDDIKKLAHHYTLLQMEFKDGGAKSRGEQQIVRIEQKLEAFTDRLNTLDVQKTDLENTIEMNKVQLQNIRLKQQEAELDLKQLKTIEIEKSGNVQEIEELVILNDNLKQQEKQFREFCKKELVRLQNLIEESKKGEPPHNNISQQEKYQTELTENVRVLRLQLGKKNRIIAALHRQIDDVPNRPELAQYQRRFLELYNQVSAKHKETKQYYTLYNTLEDTRLYMKNELSLLNSISESYPEAILSNSSKEEFLRQFQNIMEGVKNSKQKVERQVTDEKKKRDQLSSTLHVLIEQQRKYVTAVRQLSIECKKHEALLARD